jgi:hypothetical protein
MAAPSAMINSTLLPTAAQCGSHFIHSHSPGADDAMLIDSDAGSVRLADCMMIQRATDNSAWRGPAKVRRPLSLRSAASGTEGKREKRLSTPESSSGD